jgi:hypothetical protein
MSGIYREVLADLDGRIEQLQRTRDGIAALASLTNVRVSTRRGRGPSTKGRVKVGAGDRVVLEVIAGGADTFKAIVAGAKVRVSTAQAAIKRLIDAKKVKRTGMTSKTRYHAI